MNLFALAVPVVVIAVAMYPMCIHSVEEGHIGLYWTGGALMPGYTEPGYHLKLPWVTTFANVQVTLQTDTVREIPCGTSGGTMIYFDTIEVVNRLDKSNAWDTIKNYGINYDKVWVYDKIHHEINQFCSSHSLEEVYISEFATLDEALMKALQADCDAWKTGIDIMAIRVTKPRIPKSVEQNFKEVEEQKARYKVAQQQQLVLLKEEETKRMTAKIAAERESEVAVINARKQAAVETINAERVANISKIDQIKLIAEMEAVAERTKIETLMNVEKQRALAEADEYRIELEARANEKKYTPAFLQYTLYSALAQNTKVYFGESIPEIFADWFEGSAAAPVKLRNLSEKS